MYYFMGDKAQARHTAVFSTSLADPSGANGHAPHFFHFHANFVGKKLTNSRFALQTLVFTSSIVWEILDPSLVIKLTRTIKSV